MKPASIAAAFLFAFVLQGLPARADTILLKNGSWIDGVVTLKTDTFIEVQIGKIGKIDLPIEEIHLIEKNNRTGEEFNGKTYVEPKGQTEAPFKAKKPSDGPQPKIEKPAARAEDKPAAKPGDGAKAEPARSEEPKKEAPDTEEGDDEAGAKDDGKTAEETSPEAKSDIDPALAKRIEELLEDLQRQRSRNRIQAERHLEAIGQPAIPFLVKAAKSDNELTRTAIMKLFHSFGDTRCVAACIEGLLDENEYVRDYANKALKRITGEDFGFQSNSSPRRRESAQKKWSDWWEKEKKLLDEERKLSEGSR